MKNYLYIYLIVALLVSCDFLDPTEVRNPNVTDEVFVNTPNGTAPWLNGMNRQLAIALNNTIQFAEITSDNYFNNRTLSSKVFDIPQIDFFDVDVNRMQEQLQRLREMAEFGINEVIPNDTNSTPDQLAEMIYLRGIAYLIMGEYFVGLPASPNAPIATSEQLLNLAIQDFETAGTTTTNTERNVVYDMALARAYHRLGNKDQSVSFAESVIATDNLALELVLYDGLNDLGNEMQFLLFDSERDELAPLPRLDFLDPKYFTVDNAAIEQKPIALLKAEEAYFILAEAQLSDNQLVDAQNTLINLLNSVITQRPVATFDDSRENRDGGNRTDYPLTNDYVVKPSPDEDPISGLILDRQAGEVSVPSVSGTSVTEADINAATTVDELLEILYLMRQEVFIAEGRRVTDLGIKYPISQNELLNNPNILENDAFLNAQIPPFIPVDLQMDAFANDEANRVITIDVNMNQILVANKDNPSVIPFF